MITTTVKSHTGKKVYCMSCKNEIAGSYLNKGICSKCYGVSAKPRFKFGKPLFDYWRIFKMDVPALFGYLKTVLLDVYGEVQYGTPFDYLYAQGDIPILLVAHMDTVHRKLPRVEQDHEQNILWSKTGLGADDRAGVAAILHILKDGYRPHVLFTDEEECGCVGAKVASKNLNAPCVNYIVQLDRRGSTDSVYYDNDNDKFEEYVNSFGFKTANGSFTDISALCPAWGISGVNLSIGYYEAHTSSEYIKIDEWKATVKKVEKMLDSPSDNFFEYIEKPYSYGLFNTEFGENIVADKIGVSIDISAADFASYFGEKTEVWQEFLETYGDFITDEIFNNVLDTVYGLALDLCPDNFDMI
jgi:hypothetical protein